MKLIKSGVVQLIQLNVIEWLNVNLKVTLLTDCRINIIAQGRD